jgi:hypothetical protein
MAFTRKGPKGRSRKTAARKKTTLARIAVPPAAPKPVFSKAAWGGLMVSWLLVLLALLSLPNGQFLVPNWAFFSRLPFYPLLLLGFGGMVYFFRRLPEGDSGEDVPARVSRTAFFLLLILGAALRLQDIHRISGCIDNDHWIYANEALQIMNFHDRPILLPYGPREPLFAYFSALIWSFAPQATALVGMTLSSVAVDLLILWSFYLLGKEAGGRLMGLILMAMGVISKTLIQISKINFGFHTDVLACALVVLYLFRLLKNPKLSYFIQWGLAMTLGSWIYVAFRLWTPALIGGLWLWILWRPETRPKDRSSWALAGAVMGGWVFAFAYVNQMVSHQWAVVQFFSGGTGLILLVLVLFGLYARAGWQTRGKDWIWKWATGALLTALLLSPLWAQPGYSDHPNETVIFNPRFGLTHSEAWKYLNATFWNGFRLLFGYDPNNPFWNLPPMHEDSYMDYFIPAFGLAALASFFAKPRLIQAVVIGLFFTGYASFFVTHGAHSNRLMATLLPMYLIAAWGAYRLWQAFRLSGLKNGGAWGTLLLFAFAAWMLGANLQILKDWMNMRWPDTFVQDVMDLVPQDRIYLVPNQGHFGESAWDLVSEGRDTHLFLDSNLIDLTPEEKGKDVAVIIWGGDQDAHDKLSKAYPGGAWYEQSLNWPVINLKWFVIPFSQISQNPSDLFYVRTDPPTDWKRRFYLALGLGRGLIRYEDRVAHWNDGLPPSFTGGDNTARISGDWTLAKAGDYVFSLQTINTCQLWVDGRKILDVQRPSGLSLKTVKLNLAAGPHEAEIVTAFNVGHLVPQAQVHSVSEGWTKPLDELNQASAAPNP